MPEVALRTTEALTTLYLRSILTMLSYELATNPMVSPNGFNVDVVTPLLLVLLEIVYSVTFPINGSPDWAMARLIKPKTNRRDYIFCILNLIVINSR
jgi:hypothetical protein